MESKILVKPHPAMKLTILPLFLKSCQKLLKFCCFLKIQVESDFLNNSRDKWRSAGHQRQRLRLEAVEPTFPSGTWVYRHLKAVIESTQKYCVTPLLAAYRWHHQYMASNAIGLTLGEVSQKLIKLTKNDKAGKNLSKVDKNVQNLTKD